MNVDLPVSSTVLINYTFSNYTQTWRGEGRIYQEAFTNVLQEENQSKHIIVFGKTLVETVEHMNELLVDAFQVISQEG